MWRMCEICCKYGIWLGVPGESSHAHFRVIGLGRGPLATSKQIAGRPENWKTEIRTPQYARRQDRQLQNGTEWQEDKTGTKIHHSRVPGGAGGFAIIGNGFQLLGKRHMAAVLGAQTQGETHRQNDTSLAGRPKDTNPYPGRDPYRGGGASRRLHKGGLPPLAATPLCGFLYMGLSMGTGSCLWDARPAMCRFAYGFLHGSEQPALYHLSAFLCVSPWV